MTLTKPTHIIRQSWEDYKTHLRMIVSILLVPNILARFIGQLGGHYQVEPSPFSFLFIIAVTIFSIWSQVTIFMAIVKPSEKLTFVEWYKKSWKYMWSYCWLLFISGLIIFSGVLFFTVPGIIFAIWFSMSIYVLMDKELTGMDALQASTELVRGHWLAILWRYIVAGVITALASIGISILVKILHLPYGTETSGVLIATFVTPFMYLYSFHLYKELKEIKGEYTFVRSRKYFWTFVLIAIASLILVPNIIILLIVGKGLTNTRNNINDARRKTDVQVLKRGVETYYADKGTYPISLNELSNYVSKVPVDPITHKEYLYNSDGNSDFKICAHMDKTEDYCVGKSN